FARQLHDLGYQISLAVNLSARQIKDGGLADRITCLLSDLALAPHMLELEITETLLIENMAPAVQELGRLNALGVRVSVDDFGTGYSSLGYLKRLPIDTLKVDRSFVRDLPDDLEDAAITSAIVALAHSLDLSVVAEGVESTAQAEFLRGLGCEQGQGYLFSRPLAAEPLLKWLAHVSTVCRVGVS
ncbi:MAG: EAL domain-containing protein, partial [Gammaproteobacteria bacterium]|nr:EAL domain-containing protein [Gammaproteobacteria bacterium]